MEPTCSTAVMVGREIDDWIGGYKVRAFLWPTSNHIYVNVRYFAPGKSLPRPPVFDKSVFIENTPKGERLVFDFTHTLVEFVARLEIKDSCKAYISVESTPIFP